MRRSIAGLLLFLALGAGPACAEQAVEVGPWVVHYSVITTDMLNATVARNYGITRSRSRAMLNIAAQRNDGGARVPVRATIEAAATNLAGQRQSIRMREVVEQEAVYSLGFLRVTNGETFAFEVSVTPAGADRPIELRFDQQFFTD